MTGSASPRALVVLCGFNIVRLLGRHAWGAAAAIAASIVASTWLMNAELGFYDAHPREHTLILSQPFRWTAVPLEQVTGIEAPWKS